MYYTIQDDSILTAENAEILTKYYGEALELPEDYEAGKYIVVEGKLTLNENFEEEQKEQERQRLDMLSLSKREVFLALYEAKGITPDELKKQITDPKALIEFEFANDYYRGNPLINQVGALLGITPDELDYLFQNKKLPEVEND